MRDYNVKYRADWRLQAALSKLQSWHARGNSSPMALFVWISLYGSCEKPAQYTAVYIHLHSPFKQLSVNSILAQSALREPPEVSFAMRSWSLLLPSFSPLLSFSLRLLLLTHFGEFPVCENLFPQLFWHKEYKKKLLALLYPFFY